MLLVYVDTGGMVQAVRDLESAGLVKTHYYPFEQKNKRVSTQVHGAGVTWAQSKETWATVTGTWADIEASPLAPEIRRIVNQGVDTQHLDSAYKAGCTVFLTSDKTDIWSKRAELHSLLGITVLHMPSETAELQRLAGWPVGQENPPSGSGGNS